MKTERAFSLLELLVVVGLIAVLAVTAIGTLGNNEATALRAAQATLANFIVAARTKAVATNRPVRLLVNVDSGSPDRFLRQAVLQIQEGAAWTTLGEASLPEGVYVLPGNFALPPGLFTADTAGWTRNDGSSLRSTAFRSANLLTEAILSPDPESWMALPIAAVGTTNSPGDIVLANGRRRAPGEFGAGESPVELSRPEQVRGLSVSTYGVATLIDRRGNF